MVKGGKVRKQAQTKSGKGRERKPPKKPATRLRAERLLKIEKGRLEGEGLLSLHSLQRPPKTSKNAYQALPRSRQVHQITQPGRLG